ncbi:MAG: hypothetical protein KAT15_22370, partial [Bacteroidales bacterium]|nr:hypothetical protein [Bacteroidales bacterium]
RYIQLTTIACIIAFLFAGFAFAQEEDEPIYPPFETQTLIDNQTTVNPYKGSLSLEIQHRFSQIKEIADLFGIYGSANTRLGFSYGITDKIMLGFGTTRSYMLQDLDWKYSILSQTTSGRIPVSLSYYGNTVLDARDSKYFGPEDDYKFVYRLSYLQQLIVSRKLGEKIGLQMAPTFVWYNAVPEGYRNANVSLNFGGRLQVLGFHSIVFEYDQPLLQPEDVLDDAGDVVTEGKTIYPNMALGVEIGTSTHSFRVFASNYNAIVKNRNAAFNDRNPFDGDFQFGFNITIRF